MSGEPPAPMLDTQTGILQMVGRMLIAGDVAVAIDDAPLILESITRTYTLMVQLLRLRQSGARKGKGTYDVPHGP